MAEPEAAPRAEDMQERAERLRERFPSVSADRVLQSLRDHGGHAGYAATELRNLNVDVIKSADPEDSEHVATLLSNHMIFKQTCRSHFKQFDTNRNGTLEWDEVLALTNHLCSFMGLEPPGEKSLQAFFDASDANKDGVLTEREFPKFFESFLRYAFFMQHRTLVGTWRYRSAGNSSPSSEFTILLGKDYRLYYRSARGHGGTPTAQVQQGRQEVHGTLELKEGYLQADLKIGNRDDGKKGSHLTNERSYGVVRLLFIEGTTEKVITNFKLDADCGGWGNDITAKRRQTLEEERASRCSTPPIGAVLRCIAPNGCAYRRSPEFLLAQDETVNLMTHRDTEVSLAKDDTVKVIERHSNTNWVRVAGGWLPICDPRGVKLFDVELE